MPIIAKTSNSKFEPAPAGVCQAVCCDVVDLGIIETAFGPKHKVDIRWQTADLMPNNDQPFLVNKRYTLSLHEKANMRHDLEAWRGRAFTEDELSGFDLEKLIGANCQLNIVHKPGSKGGTFANIASIMPLGRGTVKINVSPEYVRVSKRVTEPEPDEGPTPDDDARFEGDDVSNVPF